VHVITRRGAGPQQTSVDVRGGFASRDRVAATGEPGTMRTHDVSATTSGATVGGSYSLSLARHGATGLYATNNDYLNNVLSGRFTYAAGAATDVRLSLRYNDYRFHYPTDGGGTPVDTNAFRTEDRVVIGAEVERRVTDALRFVVALNSSVNDGGTDDAMDGPTGSSFVSQDKTRRRGAEVRAHLLPAAAAALAFGVQVEQQDQRSQLQSESAFGPFTSRFSAARRNLGGYAEAALTPTSTLTATIGARVDDNQEFGTFLTGRGGLSFRPMDGTRLRATLGNAFREPSFFENYSTGFVTGNPGLRPERTLSADAGLDQQLFGGRADVSLTAFAQRFRDMIDYSGSATACGFSYCNVAEATSRGIEAELGGRLIGPLWGRVGATFLRTGVTEPGFDTSSAGLYRQGESLIRRPERTVNAELTWRGDGPVTLSGRVLAVGIRHDRDFTTFPSTPVILPSYERVDLSARYALRVAGTQGTAVTIRIENATNAGYQNVYNFLTPRRTVSVGLRVGASE
jgi:vitamin B12 transporter